MGMAEKAAGVTGVILAGGKSSRLGRDKAFLDFGGRPLIAHVHGAVCGLFREVIVVAPDPSAFSFLPMRVISDTFAGKGPLAGVQAGLAALSPESGAAFLLACDLPFVNPDLVRHLIGLWDGHQAVVPKRGSFFEPLHALYDRRCLPAVEAELAGPSPRVSSFFSRVDVRYAGPDEVEPFGPWERLFFNINTDEDYALALSLLGSMPSWVRRFQP